MKMVKMLMISPRRTLMMKTMMKMKMEMKSLLAYMTLTILMMVSMSWMPWIMMRVKR